MFFIMQTGFKRIARSGNTIDRRKIDPQWLIDAAESYSKETYTALVYPDHYDWYVNYGTVDELDYKKLSNGVVELYANFTPNDLWRAQVKEGQRQYTSIAVDTNFAQDGKAYVYSIGATNNPASLGVEKLEFSKRFNRNNDDFFIVRQWSLIMTKRFFHLIKNSLFQTKKLLLN